MHDNLENIGKNDKLLSIGEASEYLGVSIDTLRRWEKKEKVKSYRSPGGHRYFRKNDLDTLFCYRHCHKIGDHYRKQKDQVHLSCDWLCAWPSQFDEYSQTNL